MFVVATEVGRGGDVAKVIVEVRMDKLTAMFVSLDGYSSGSLLIQSQCLAVTDNDKGQWIKEAGVRAIDAGSCHDSALIN